MKTDHWRLMTSCISRLRSPVREVSPSMGRKKLIFNFHYLAIIFKHERKEECVARAEYWLYIPLPRTALKRDHSNSTIKRLNFKQTGCYFYLARCKLRFQRERSLATSYHLSMSMSIAVIWRCGHPGSRLPLQTGVLNPPIWHTMYNYGTPLKNCRQMQ